jgi:uncharacterized protein (DUF302 family)
LLPVRQAAWHTLLRRAYQGGLPIIAEIGFEVRIPRPFDQVIDEVIEALRLEGFGVLTRLDVRKTIKEKLDVEFRPYVILGAYNPPLAHRALAEDSVIGLQLPCNVTIESDDSEGSIVRLANPEVALLVGSFEENPVLIAIARETRSRLERVAESLIVR